LHLRAGGHDQKRQRAVEVAHVLEEEEDALLGEEARDELVVVRKREKGGRCPSLRGAGGSGLLLLAR
jgi:hypothetical protein